MELDITTTNETPLLTGRHEEPAGFGSLVVLRCRGRLVFGDGAGPLRDAARHAFSRGQGVALDLGRVTQIDAHGTGVLAELTGVARREGRRIMVAGASDRVRRVLHTTHLDTVLPGIKDAVVLRRDAAACHEAAAAHV